MAKATKPRVTRPFHESIVDAIRSAPSHYLPCLGALIKATTIPAGHDAIIKAWKKYCKEISWGDDFGVTASLELRRDATVKAKGASLDELQEAAERLVALLTDRQLGLVTWQDCLYTGLEKIHKLTSQALGK